MKMKKAFIFGFLFVFILCGFLPAGEPPITGLRRSIERYNKDPLAVRSMNPVFDEFPDSSLVDFSYLLDPPAGKFGFVKTGEDGHFHFEKNNQRIRFWGVTVAAAHIDIPKERIRLAVDTIARSGCNLLRLHEIDNRGGEKYSLVRRNIIDEAWPNNDNSRHFDPEYRDRVDYWISCAKARGIYVYLVVRAYRTFRAGDEVAAADKLDRKARPYGYFNARLIELQDEYITQWLFKHKNPYTGLPNGLDPAVCMIELINEDSLFCDPSEWVNFIEPYKSEFRQLWNEWLKSQYGDTEKLRDAWWLPDSSWSALMADERLENGTVQIPDMKTRQMKDIKPEKSGEALSHPLRQKDGTKFAVYLQRKIFSRQRDVIRAAGCPIPLTAVVNSQVAPDTWSVIQELDFTGENAYQDHPAFKGGEEWVGKAFYQNGNYLKQRGAWSAGPYMAQYKWAGKPLVCREWALCWPNEFRSSANLNMAAQALLQDYDAMIHFAYYTTGDHFACSAFAPQADPARWGTFGYAADLFITGDIEPADRVVEVVYTDDDLFYWGDYMNSLYTLAWECRVQNRHFSGAAASDADIRIASGRSGLGVFAGSHNILWDGRFDRWADFPADARRKGIFFSSGYQEPILFNGGDFPTSAVLRAGFEPLWEAEGSCAAFFDPRQKNILSINPDSAKTIEAARGLLDMIEKQDTKYSPAPEPQTVVIRSGEIIRDFKNGRMVINTPRLRALQGEFKITDRVLAGSLAAISRSPVACIAAVSLDKKPIEESMRFSLKMVTQAINRGQLLKPISGRDVPGNFILEHQGSVPVQTLGRATETPTSIWLGAELLVEVYMINGTWEIIVDREKKEVCVFCDTPNMRFNLGKAAFGESMPENLYMQKYFVEYPPAETAAVKPDFIYPGYAKYVRLTVKP